MKRLFLILAAICLLVSLSAGAQEIIKGGVELDWPLLNQEERDKTIKYYRDTLFKDVEYKIEKEQFKSKKKDPNIRENRNALKYDQKKLSDREIAGFYFLDKILYAYGVKYYADKYHIYYYNAAGGLEFVDILDRPHHVYPHIAYQYRKNGKLIGAFYYISEYDQYAFDQKGKFKGRWYGERFYDKKAKIIMTRRLP